jgi:hypothetical protein
VILYRPIYQKMYSLTNINLKVEIAQGKSITKTTSVGPTGDTVRTRKIQIEYTDQSSFAETTKQIIPKEASLEKPAPEVKKEVTLGGENYWLMIVLILVQVILVTMVYGPVAAFLVELFPTRIRYTSMSLPYHIGFGVFGGLTPFIATALYEASKTKASPGGDPLTGLWYPIIVAAACFVIGMIFLPNKRTGDSLE